MWTVSHSAKHNAKLHPLDSSESIFYPTASVVRLYPLWRATGFGQNLSASAALLGACNELTINNTKKWKLSVLTTTSIRQLNTADLTQLKQIAINLTLVDRSKLTKLTIQKRETDCCQCFTHFGDQKWTLQMKTIWHKDKCQRDFHFLSPWTQWEGAGKWTLMNWFDLIWLWSLTSTVLFVFGILLPKWLYILFILVWCTHIPFLNSHHVQQVLPSIWGSLRTSCRILDK